MPDPKLDRLSLIERKDHACAVCGHAISRHDPEDGTCDAHAEQGFGVCPCGRDVTVANYRGAVDRIAELEAALRLGAPDARPLSDPCESKRVPGVRCPHHHRGAVAR